MKKITVSILTTLLMLSMVFSSSVFAAEKEVSAWDSFLGLFGVNASETTDVGVEYRGHIQNIGNYPLDGSWIQGPTELGTEGKSLRLEGFWIQLNGDVPADAHIEYQVHVQNVGWMDPVQDGAFAGTEGKSQQIEAIKISLVDDEGVQLKDYSVVYTGHVQNKGDVGPYTNGEQLGTDGEFLRLEAITVEIVQNPADLAEYEAALAAVTQADYTAASWTAYQAVVNANVVDEDNLQSEVDAATANIVAAQANLVKVLKVESVSALNVKQLKVVYNTTVDKTIAETIANYTIGSLGASSTNSIAALQADGKTVLITLGNVSPFTPQMVNQTKYNVTIKNIKGTDGQFLADTTVKDVQCIDTELPVVSSIQVTGPKALKVVFNKPVSATNANFLLDNGAVGVDSTVVSVPADNALTITTSAALAVGQHTLVVNNSANNSFVDFAGLIVYKSTNTFEVVADTAAPTVSVKKATPTKITLQFNKPVKDLDNAANEVKVGYSVIATTSITPVAATSSTYNSETYATEWEVVPATAIAGSVVDVKIDNKATTKADQILDKFDNKFVTTTVTANIVADTLKPAVNSVEVKSDKQLVVTFNKEVTEADAENRINYLLYNKDGALIKNESGVTDAYGQLASGTTFTYDNTKKQVTIDFASSLKPENYSLKISNIKDTVSYNQQTIEATTIGFNVADKSQLQLSSAAWVSADRTITLTFTKAVATSGDGNALEIANYKINGAALDSASTATLGGNSNMVVITLGGSTNVNGQTIAAAVKDSAGNLIDVAHASATLAGPTIVAGDLQNMKLIDDTTVTIEVKKPLKSFTVKAGSTVADEAIVSGSYTNQNITVSGATVYGSVVTLKVAEGTLSTGLVSSTVADSSGNVAATNVLSLAIDSLETIEGAKNSSALNVAKTTMNEKDYAAPVLKTISTDDVDGNGMLDKILVEYTEPIQSGDVGTASYTVNGYTVSNAYVSAAGNGTPATSGKYAEVIINEIGHGDTGETPATKQVVDVRDISAQANIKPAESVASKTTTDAAAPVLMTVATTIADNTTAGTATDKVQVVFSESVTGSVATEYVLGATPNKLTGSVISGTGNTYVVTLGTDEGGTPVAAASLVFTRTAAADAAGNAAANATITSANITYGATL